MTARERLEKLLSRRHPSDVRSALDAYRDEVLREAAARQWVYWTERETAEVREHGSLDHETEIGREAVQEVINVIDPDRMY